MLKISNLSVNIGETNVIDGVDFEFQPGKNYTLVGRNGSGKSSLTFAIMGSPQHEITKGDISLNGTSIVDMSPDERSRNGIFVAFQNIPEIPGVKLFDFLKQAYNSHLPEDAQPLKFIQFKKIIEPIIKELEIDRDFLFRDLNVGFSGGEKRKIEILQIRLLNPKYIILDEVDSGLDVNSLKQLGNMLQDIDSEDNTFIFISHYFDVLDYVNIDSVYVMEGGVVKTTGDKSLIDKIKAEGF